MKEPNHSSRGRHNIRYWQWHTRYFRISKLTFYVLGAIVNYASHIMCVTVNYLASNRPFNFTAYCRHDIQVTEIVLFLRSLFYEHESFRVNTDIFREIYHIWKISEPQSCFVTFQRCLISLL